MVYRETFLGFSEIHFRYDRYGSGVWAHIEDDEANVFGKLQDLIRWKEGVTTVPRFTISKEDWERVCETEFYARPAKFRSLMESLRLIIQRHQLNIQKS